MPFAAVSAGKPLEIGITEKTRWILRFLRFYLVFVIKSKMIYPKRILRIILQGLAYILVKPKMEVAMFVYSIRASTIRFFAVIALTLALLVGVLAFGSTGDVSASSGAIDFSGIKTADDRIGFISQFGLTADENSEEYEEFRVPENFDRVIAGYNEIQQKQGLNIGKYKNKKVTRYTYSLKNYSEGDAVVNLIVYKGTVIACDISSAEPGVFVYPLVKL